MVIRKISLRNVYKPHVSPGIQSSLFLFGSVFIAVVFTQILKRLIQSPRPEGMLIAETGFSFPSGHATVASAFFVAVIFCVYVFYQNWPKVLKRLIAIVSVLLIVLVSASRLVLNVHRPIDVVCGIVLGGFVVWLVQIYTKVWSRKNQ